MADKLLLVREGTSGLVLVRGDMAETDYNLLHADAIDGTDQEVVIEDGIVSRIIYIKDGETIRTDAYTITDETIIEVRTLSSGASLTLTTDLDTLTTTVVYSAAN